MEKVSIAYIRDGGGIFGAERVILTTAKNIDRKFNIILICTRSNDGTSSELMERAKEIGIQVIPVDINGKIDVKAIYNIRKILIKNHVKILHSYDFKSNLYGLFASINLDIKRVITAGGTTRDSLVKKFYMFIDEAFTYKYYNNIIAVSHEICERLTKRNIGKGRIIVIENGIDPSLYDDETYEGNNHEPLPIDKSKRVFAVIGRLFPDKGHRFFLQAFSHVVQNNSLNIALLIGDGPSEEDIKIQIKDLKLENNVFLCGVRKDMKYIYNNVDYIVMPSLTEGLPYVLLEAMLYKVPILATDVGGISSLVKNDVTGYLVPPGDVESLKNDMNKMLNNPEKIKTMAENAYNLVKEEYSARRMVDQIGHLYDTMINDRLDRHA